MTLSELLFLSTLINSGELWRKKWSSIKTR
jgi:hypothetical protein